MKKLTQLFFALFLVISLGTQAQEKKTFKGAMAHANFTEQEAAQATEINKAKGK